MKASELIAQLQALVDQHGDLEVKVPFDYDAEDFKDPSSISVDTTFWNGTDIKALPQPEIRIS